MLSTDGPSSSGVSTLMFDGFFFNGLLKADGSPIKDLNDFLEADHRASKWGMEITTGAFDFALEGRAQ